MSFRRLFVTLAALTTLAFAAGCHSMPFRGKSAAKPQPAPHGPIRVACIGDSITEGAGTKEPAFEAYPVQLGQLLGSRYVVRNFGVGGATLLNKGDKPYRRLTAYSAALGFEPDIVVVALGTNDTKPQNWVHRDEFAADYAALIARLRALPSHPRIIICQPMPAWPPSGWGISPEIIAGDLHRLIADIAAREQVKLVNLYAPMEKRAKLVPDFVHPDARGAAIIAKTVAKAIKAKK